MTVLPAARFVAPDRSVVLLVLLSPSLSVSLKVKDRFDASTVETPAKSSAVLAARPVPQAIVPNETVLTSILPTA